MSERTDFVDINNRYMKHKPEKPPVERAVDSGQRRRFLRDEIQEYKERHGLVSWVDVIGRQ